MASPTLDERKPAFAAMVAADSESFAQRRAARRRRSIVRWLTTLAVLAIVVYALFYAFNSLGKSKESTGGKTLTYTVQRADLVATVTEDGTIESSSNIDVKCEVAGGSTILSIVKDGTQVNQGDELVRLDSSAIEEQVSLQKINFEKALSTRIESEKNFEAAKIAVQEYVEGTYVQELQTIEANITVAMENLRSSQNSLQHTERMARKGYVTALQRDAQAFAVERAKLDLKSAETAKHVLEKFTRAKMVGDLESARDKAEAKMRSDQAAFDLEQQRLNRLNTQLEKCVVVAPRDGMVVYANEQNFRGQQSAQIEEGSAVRERQSLIRLPDLTTMQAKVTIHESKVDRLRVGMRARVRIQDHELQGTVYSIANQAEPSNWFSPNVKKYATIVRIDGEASGLRPGMTAVVEILVANLEKVLSVPEQAVVEQGDKYYVWVDKAIAPERRPVVLGINNTTHIEIKDGLVEGDSVLLNPRAIVKEAREEVKAKESADVKKKFGEAALVKGDGGTKSGDARAAGGPEGGKRGKGRDNFDPMQFDKNGDKKLSKDEAPEKMQEYFDTIDGNHDGFLDAKELAVVRRMMRPGGGGPGGPGAPSGGR